MFNPFFLQTSESLQQVARSFGEVSHRPEETPLITAGILVAAACLAKEPEERPTAALIAHLLTEQQAEAAAAPATAEPVDEDATVAMQALPRRALFDD